jgi:hypothetical protein
MGCSWAQTRALTGPSRCACVFALSVCLAAAVALVRPEASLAISGFATDGPAVTAQYPDAPGATAGGPQLPATLRMLIASQRPSRNDRAAERRRRVARREVEAKTTRALASAAGLDPRQSGSVGLLVLGITTVSVASLLRWRRGMTAS